MRRRGNATMGFVLIFFIIILILRRIFLFLKPYLLAIINYFKQPFVINNILIFIGCTSIIVLTVLIINRIIRINKEKKVYKRVNPRLKEKWKQNSMMNPRRWKKCYRNELLPFIPIMKMIYGKKFDIYKESYTIWKSCNVDSDKWMIAFVKKMDEILYFQNSNFSVRQVDEAVEKLTHGLKIEI